MDRLLWTYKDDSFIPHGLNSEADNAKNPVLIGHDENPGQSHDVLINLSYKLPNFFSRFSRVAECIDADPNAKEAGREHYRFYKERGYPLDTHKLQL